MHFYSSHLKIHIIFIRPVFAKGSVSVNKISESFSALCIFSVKHVINLNTYRNLRCLSVLQLSLLVYKCKRLVYVLEVIVIF